MLSKSTTDTQKISSGQKHCSILHNDILIKGDLTSNGIVEVGGEIIGDITADFLVITSEGRVNGNVRAHNVTIQGQLEGTVSAVDMVVKTTAKVMANVKTELILIELGAEIQGNIQVVGKSAEDDI